MLGQAAAGHRDVERGSCGGLAEHGVGGVGGDALGGVHGDRVTEVDVLTNVVAVEDGVGSVVEPFGGHSVGVGVEEGDAPALPVAHRVLVVHIGCGRMQGDGWVVAAAQDEIADGDALPACTGHELGPGRRPFGVEAFVEGVGDFTGVAHQ